MSAMRPFTIRKAGEDRATLVLAIGPQGQLLIAAETNALIWVRAESYELGEAFFTADEGTFAHRFQRPAST